MKVIFNDNFLFGAATSGPQTEGWINKKNDNVYDYWYKQNKNDFFEQIGPNKVNNTYQEYEKDIEIMKQIGLQSFRTSIQWSRLFSNLEDFVLDDDAVKFYRSYFLKIKESGIHLIVNLFHFDIPQYFLETYGGFENRKMVDFYAKYAEICFRQFGDIVDDWSTFNEPSADTEAKYLEAWHYPFVKDFNRFINASHNMMLSHARAVSVFRMLFKNDKKKRITIILNLTPTYPKNSQIKNVEAAHICELIFNKFYLEAAVLGAYPIELIEFMKTKNIKFNLTDEDKEILRLGKVDFLGVNYYQPRRVQNSINAEAIAPYCWFNNYIWPKRRINPYRGWEIHPQTIYKIASDIKNNYNNIPFYISENGMGVEAENRFLNKEGIIDDDYRIEFISEHLYWLSKAIKEGANCFGYHHWTLIDCWSWANAFKNRYGYVSLDLTNGKKTIKKSGQWISELIKHRFFIYDKSQNEQC